MLRITSAKDLMSGLSYICEYGDEEESQSEEEYDYKGCHTKKICLKFVYFTLYNLNIL